MPDFKGPESSDIVYDDVQGEFTNLLMENGHLSGESWAGKTPRYYIEVKTTTLDCATQFFVSGGQYTRVSWLPSQGSRTLSPFK